MKPLVHYKLAAICSQLQNGLIAKKEIQKYIVIF